MKPQIEDVPCAGGEEVARIAGEVKVKVKKRN